MTVFAWLVMSAVVSGVVEETAFRGYVQGGIERRHGLTTAIVVIGGLFGLTTAITLRSAACSCPTTSRLPRSMAW